MFYKQILTGLRKPAPIRDATIWLYRDTVGCDTYCIDTHLSYIDLLYFAWADQRVQQFYNYHNVSELIVIELWLGSYRTLE